MTVIKHANANPSPDKLRSWWSEKARKGAHERGNPMSKRWSIPLRVMSSENEYICVVVHNAGQEPQGRLATFWLRFV